MVNRATDINEINEKNLMFTIGNETYGIDIRYVSQIMSIQEITPAADQPEFVKGTINLREQTIPIIDVRLRFKKTEKEYDDRTCIIVLTVDDDTVGIIVDNVAEVVTLSSREISVIPEFNKSLESSYIRGIGRQKQQVYILLECSELVKIDQNKLLDKL